MLLQAGLRGSVFQACLFHVIVKIVWSRLEHDLPLLTATPCSAPEFFPRLPGATLQKVVSPFVQRFVTLLGGSDLPKQT